MIRKDLSFYTNVFFKTNIIRLKNIITPYSVRGIREQNWGLRFSFAITNSKWFKEPTLNPGRWAIGFPAIYAIFRILDEMQPKEILEFGLGESSKITYQYYSNSGNTGLTIIEQDSNWLNFFNQRFFKVQKLVKILPISTEKIFGKKCYAYRNLMANIADKKYDFIIIDGPWGSINYSRSQIVEIINQNLLAEDFVILMDDVNRFGERQTLELIFLTLKERGIRYYKGIYSGEKDVCVVCSEKLKFLTSL